MFKLQTVRIVDRMIPFSCVALATMLIASTTNVFAVNIFSNPITDSNPSTANPYTNGQTSDPNITVTGLGRGSGVTANSGSNRYNATSWNLGALDINDYFTWTLTPATGYEMSLNSLSGNWQRSATGPQQYMLKTSLDNFVSSVSSGAITGSANAVAYNIDLTSAAALQNVTTPVEFRLYAWGGTNAAGTFSINDFTFDGAVAQTSGTTAFAGDYNGDGVVDAADFVTYAKAVTSGGTLLNETASPGVVDSADYDTWRQNFGNTQSVGGGAGLHSGGVEVPEPTPLALLVAAVLFIGAGTQARRQGSPHRLRYAP